MQLKALYSSWKKIKILQQIAKNADNENYILYQIYQLSIKI